ncbi:TPA: acetyltransferase [Salmonella enterica]|uniref:hypothetical protein n=1 Tax=Salmonella enterica TaxID=28901 RepID=UPI0009B0C83C|nr:hypothetical protein [Salmonella enterica]HBD1844101.1 acetyltransferase [Salmonella enterica]
MMLKFSQPDVLPAFEEVSLFALQAQGCPVMSAENAIRLSDLREAIAERVSSPVTVTCHPHRVGLRNNMSIHIEDSSENYVDILITIGGNSVISWPSQDDFIHPRWYITVPDAVDALYLTLYLNTIFSEYPQQ